MTNKKQEKRIAELVNKIRFLCRCHIQTGADMDYILALDINALEFLYLFVKEYYNGQTTNISAKKEANRRRYRAKQTDALSKYRWNEQVSECESYIDDLDGEKLLLLKEKIETEENFANRVGSGLPPHPLLNKKKKRKKD